MKQNTTKELKKSSLEFITPTKKEPIFVADCDHFGYIEDSPYKKARVFYANDGGYSTIKTFGTSFMQAVNDLHQWIIDNDSTIYEMPKCKFNIYLVDGTIDKYDQMKLTKVYTINAAKAKKLLS